MNFITPIWMRQYHFLYIGDKSEPQKCYNLFTFRDKVFFFFFLPLNCRASYIVTKEWRRQWHPTPVLLPGKSHGTEEPGRLQSMGSLKVRHNWATSLSLFTFMHWKRKWQPTPVFLPGESQGWGSLVGCRLWGGTESDMTEATQQQQQQQQINE